MPRAAFWSTSPNSTYLTDPFNLNKLHPSETKHSSLNASPAHTKPAFTLKRQNLARTAFCENIYRFLSFLSFHPENEFFGAMGKDLDLHTSSLRGGSLATHFFNLWIQLVLVEMKELSYMLLAFHPQASEGYRPLIHVFI